MTIVVLHIPVSARLQFEARQINGLVGLDQHFLFFLSCLFVCFEVCLEMFKKFNAEENISSISQVKNSVQRSIQSQIVEQFPLLEESIETILPKKSIVVGKAQDNIQLVIVNNEILFFNQRDGPFFPTLKLLHKFPNMMPWMQVDTGAIRFVLGGANIMCPGFTSAGGQIPKPLPAGSAVAIYAEGKSHAMALGITKMSTDDIQTKNKGIAVDTIHYLMDGLWQTNRL